jgi:hypothetical protein
MQMEGKPNEKTLSPEAFEKVKARAEIFYGTIKPVYCPYLKNEVHFNAKGLEHIKFKEWNKPRVMFDQLQRLKIIDMVPFILGLSHTVQGIWERKEWQRQKKHGRWEKMLKEVVYYEFIAVIDSIRAKVVLKEIKGNPPFFWTVIPYWKMNEITNKRILHDRDIITDGNFSDDIEE